jgi:hypothetical protein
VIDFNYDSYDNKLYIVDSKYKMCAVNIVNYSIEYIDSGGYFKKESNNTKSANNLYRIAH